MEKGDNTEFKQRLASACDRHPDVPPAGDGRQAWLADKLKVSAEASRKWFSGRSRPRPAMMARLAQVLECDEAWLSLGITPLRDKKDTADYVRNASGAVYLVAGLLELEGGKVAFPSPDKEEHNVDMHAVIGGRHLTLHVAVAQRVSVGKFRLTVPYRHDGLAVIGVFPSRDDLMPRLISLPSADINERGTQRGGCMEIEVATDGGAFVTDDHEWPRISTFTCPLRSPEAAMA